MATTKTWFGGNGGFYDADKWTPAEVPQSGDTALIRTGSVRLQNGTLSGVTVALQGTSAATAPKLALHNEVLNSNVTIFGSPQTGRAYGEIDVSNIAVNDGRIVQGGRESLSNLTVNLGRHASFVNSGTMRSGLGSDLTVQGGGKDALFVNTGTVSLSAGTVDVKVPVVGDGVFSLGPAPGGGGRLEFEQPVGNGTVVTSDSRGGPNLLVLDKPMEFLGTIENFPNNHLDLPNTTVTSATFSDNELRLFDHDALVARLNIVGDLTADRFTITPADNGGTSIIYRDPPATAAAAASPLTAQTQTDALVAVLPQAA